MLNIDDADGQTSESDFNSKPSFYFFSRYAMVGTVVGTMMDSLSSNNNDAFEILLRSKNVSGLGGEQYMRLPNNMALHVAEPYGLLKFDRGYGIP